MRREVTSPGLFEHCEILLHQKLIDEATFRDIYRYRLVNIVCNATIRRGRLAGGAPGWERFLALLQRMNIDLAE